jgi:hypothetical protein
MKMAFAALDGVYRVLVLGGRVGLRQGYGTTNTAGPAAQSGTSRALGDTLQRYVSAKW